MIALAVVLFTLTARSETGKADAGIARRHAHRLLALRGARGRGRPRRPRGRRRPTADRGPRVRHRHPAAPAAARRRSERHRRDRAALLARRAGCSRGPARRPAWRTRPRRWSPGRQMRGTLFVSLTDARDFAAPCAPADRLPGRRVPQRPSARRDSARSRAAQPARGSRGAARVQRCRARTTGAGSSRCGTGREWRSSWRSSATRPSCRTRSRATAW